MPAQFTDFEKQVLAAHKEKYGDQAITVEIDGEHYVAKLAGCEVRQRLPRCAVLWLGHHFRDLWKRGDKSAIEHAETCYTLANKL